MPKNVINFSYSLPFNKYNVLCHKTFIMLKQPKIADRQSSLNVQKRLPGVAKYLECPPGTEVGQRLWLGTGVSGWRRWEPQPPLAQKHLLQQQIHFRKFLLSPNCPADISSPNEPFLWAHFKGRSSDLCWWAENYKNVCCLFVFLNALFKLASSLCLRGHRYNPNWDEHLGKKHCDISRTSKMKTFLKF